MNKFLQLYRKPFSLPVTNKHSLREKIKDSDCLVTDEKGTHRLIGLKYVSETMNAPVITFICMRHEMSLAKQIAFELGKEFFYNSAVSATLFKYQTGETICSKDCTPIAELYAVVETKKNCATLTKNHKRRNQYHS